MINQEYVDNVKNMVCYLRKGKNEEAIKLLSTVTMVLKSLALDTDPVKLKNKVIVIRAIMDSFQRKDYVLMADLLEYEVLPLVKNIY